MHSPSVKMLRWEGRPKRLAYRVGCTPHVRTGSSDFSPQLSLHRAQGKKAAVPLYKVLTIPGLESNSGPTNAEVTCVLTTEHVDPTSKPGCRQKVLTIFSKESDALQAMYICCFRQHLGERII